MERVSPMRQANQSSLVAELQVDEEGVRSVRNNVRDTVRIFRSQRRTECCNLSGRHRELAVEVVQALVVEGNFKVLVEFVADAAHSALKIQRVRAADVRVGLEVFIHTEYRKWRVPKLPVSKEIESFLPGAVPREKRRSEARKGGVGSRTESERISGARAGETGPGGEGIPTQGILDCGQ